MGKIEAGSQKIDKKYGNVNSDARDRIKNAQLGNQVKSMDRKLRRLTNAGVANQDVLDRANKMTNKGYENKTNGK